MRLLLFVACLGTVACTTEQTSETEQDATRTPLAAGEVRTYGFANAKTGDIDPRFKKINVSGARDVAFHVNTNGQKMTLTATNADDKNGDLALQVDDFAVDTTGGKRPFYKAWLLATVTDSDSEHLGFCGDGGFDKGSLHAQIQLQFYKNTDSLALCYCNICPTTEGHDVTCATDQWVLPQQDGPKVSDSGACGAPAGTNHMVVTLEAVAKPDAPKHHHGTAVIEKFTVARCANSGDCEALTPNYYGK